MCGIEVTEVNRRRHENDSHQYRPGMQVHVSRGLDIGVIASRLPEPPGCDRQGADELWTMLIAEANAAFVDGSTVRRSGVLTIPSLEDAQAAVDGAWTGGACVPGSAEPEGSGDLRSESFYAAQRASLVEESAARAAAIHGAFVETVHGGGGTAPIEALTAGMEERPESVLHDVCNGLPIAASAFEATGQLAQLATGVVQTAGITAEAVAVPASLVVSVVCGLEGLGSIGLERVRAGVANGYTDALLAQSRAADFDATPQPPRNVTAEYQRGWNAATEHLARLRTNDPEGYMESMRTLWRTDRDDLYGAVYGEGIYGQDEQR